MAKKIFVIVDTETTQSGMVADMGIVVADKQGRILHETGILIGEFFSDKEKHPLFHVFGDKNDIFSKESLPARYADYEQMLQDGRRVLASVGAVNRYLSKVKAKYPQAILTAYNLAFDLGKMNNSGIIADELFPERFCLWHAATEKWANTRAYKQFVLENQYPTRLATEQRLNTFHQLKHSLTADFLLCPRFYNHQLFAQLFV